ncbi:MAG: GNAT family N-acetyltransferase [Acidobacteriia bacterium]|nr:GNAT family N-acetyltransferase [Terriglobia bacterium]
MPAPEIRAVADNLVEALRFFGRARQDAEICDLPGVTLIFCGLNYAAFNAALLTRQVDDDAAELERLVQLSAAHFEARKLRWTLWICDDFLSGRLRRQAPLILDRWGLRLLTQAPGMYAAHLLPPDRALPSVEVRRVDDERTRTAFAEIMSTAFEIPHSVSASIYGSERAWCSGFQGYVGFENGRAVTSAASTMTTDAIGLYSVATLPQHRRRGFAEAIMRQVLERAATQPTVLQSTSSGLSLYEKMGYRTVTDFAVYIAD